MCRRSERLSVEHAVITGRYLRWNINNSCSKRSRTLSRVDVGRMMQGEATFSDCLSHLPGSEEEVTSE